MVKDEDRDVWKAKLEQEDFEEALRYAKVCGAPVTALLTNAC